MEYKGLHIVPAVAGWVGSGDWGYLFSIYKKRGDELEKVHSEENLIGPFPTEAVALQEATQAARTLIDLNGPYSF